MSKANESPPAQGRKGGRHSPGLFHPKRERVEKASQFNTKKGRRLAQDRQHDCPNQSVLLHRLQSPGQGDGDMPAPRGDQGEWHGRRGRDSRRPGPGPSFVEDDSLHLNEWRLTRPLLESILNGYTQQWPRQDGGAPRTGRALQGRAHHLACDQDTGRTSPGTPHRTARMAP